jgi:hypothetical protein
LTRRSLADRVRRETWASVSEVQALINQAGEFMLLLYSAYEKMDRFAFGDQSVFADHR